MNVIDKMSKYIMCIPTQKLFENYSFEGFSEHSLFDFAGHIAQGYEYRMRGPLETDSSYKQTIPYVIVVDQDTQKILAYKRSTQGGDSRIHGHRSWGVGGHIEQEDVSDSSQDFFKQAAIREIQEELHISKINDLQIIGYIHDLTNDISQVHFGLVYITYISQDNLAINDGEIEKIQRLDKKDLFSLVSSPDNTVETWSQLLIEPLHKILS